jgi:hypothetical protein
MKINKKKKRLFTTNIIISQNILHIGKIKLPKAFQGLQVIFRHALWWVLVENLYLSCFTDFLRAIFVFIFILFLSRRGGLYKRDDFVNQIAWPIMICALYISSFTFRFLCVFIPLQHQNCPVISFTENCRFVHWQILLIAKQINCCTALPLPNSLSEMTIMVLILTKCNILQTN